MARRDHPGTIQRRSGKKGHSYRVILYAGGERHSYTLQGGTAKKAREFARSKHAELQEIVERERVGLPGATSLDDLLELYEEERIPLLAKASQNGYKQTLRLLRRFLKERSLALQVHEFRSGHVQAFLSWLKVNPERKGPKTVSNRTVQRHRTSLSALLSFAVELELVEYNPVHKVKAPKVDKRDPVILSDAQYEKLIEKASGNRMLRLYILVLGETGVRSGSEALWLRWEDVDLEGGFLRIVSGRHDHRTKSGEGRWVPMTPRMREAMRAHFARFRFTDHGSSWVFHHELKRRHAKRGARLKSLHRALKSASERAKLPPEFRQHDLRHRRVTKWLAEGKPIHLVQEAVGHSTVRTTEIYKHLAREHLKSLVEGGETVEELSTGTDGDGR